MGEKEKLKVRLNEKLNIQTYQVCYDKIRAFIGREWTLGQPKAVRF